MFSKFTKFLFYYPLFIILCHNINFVCAIEVEKELSITSKELFLLNMVSLSLKTLLPIITRNIFQLSERVMKISTEPRFKTKLAMLRWLRGNLIKDEKKQQNVYAYFSEKSEH
jgi:hypothetical protein